MFDKVQNQAEKSIQVYLSEFLQSLHCVTLNYEIFMSQQVIENGCHYRQALILKAVSWGKLSTNFPEDFCEKIKNSTEKITKKKKKSQRKSKSFYLTLQNYQEKTHSRVYFNKYTGFTCATLITTHSLILFSTYSLNFADANPKIVFKRQCFQNSSRYHFLVLLIYLWIIPHGRSHIGVSKNKHFENFEKIPWKNVTNVTIYLNAF